MISKWFVCTETHKVASTAAFVHVRVCGSVRVYYSSWEYKVLQRNIHKQKEFSSKLKVSLSQLFCSAAELNVLLSFPVLPSVTVQNAS